MDFRPVSAGRAELERLRASGALTEAVSVERAGDAQAPVLVRPPGGDAMDGWMPAVHEALGVVRGVVAVSGPDMQATAHLAAAAAAWLGDRGRNVVLADASVAAPLVGKPLPEDGDEGLVDAALFGVSPQAVVRRTLAKGVRVVTVGSHPLTVERVFDDHALPRLLGALAEDALVLVLVDPAHLSRLAPALDAAICAAGRVEDLAALASRAGGVRTTGVLFTEARAAEPAAAGQPGGPRGTGAPAAGKPDGPRGTGAPAADRRGAATLAPGKAEEPALIPTVTRPRPGPERGRTSGVPAAALVVVVLIVGAALIWWLTDGQRRFGAAGDGPTRSEPSFVADGEGREEAVQRTVQPGELEGQTGTEPVAPAGESEARLEEEAGEGPVTNDAAPLLRPSGEMLISGPGGPYRVMVSSHKHEAAAALEADELAGVGVDAEVAPAEIEGRGIWYRVLVSGGYPSLTRARTVLDTIKSFGYEGAWIERAPR